MSDTNIPLALTTSYQLVAQAAVSTEGSLYGLLLVNSSGAARAATLKVTRHSDGAVVEIPVDLPTAATPFDWPRNIPLQPLDTVHLKADGAGVVALGSFALDSVTDPDSPVWEIKGEWSSVVEYDALDVVSRAGSSFAAIRANLNSTPVAGSNTADWLCLFDAATLSGQLLASNNLSDLADAATARTNLGVASLLDAKLDDSQLDTDGTLAANSDSKIASQKAVKTYVASVIAATDVMIFKGVIDASANPNYPAADAGWTYRISAGGKIGGASGINVQAGDILLCLTDGAASGNQATVGANWSIIQANIDGALVTTDIGASVQAYSAILASIAALTGAANDDVIQRKAGAFVNRTLAQLKTDLLATAGNGSRTVAIAKGNSGTGTVTFDVAAGEVQTLTNTGAHTWAFTWPSGHSEIEIIVTNAGANAMTLPTVNWLSGDGTKSTTFSTMGVTLQASGVNTFLLWSPDGGTTVYGRAA